MRDASQIREEVNIFYGLRDKHHPFGVYEEIAKRIPKARYFSAVTPEDKRELACAVIGLEFCKVLASDGIPKSLQPLEKSIIKVK